MSHNPALDKTIFELIPNNTASILDLGCGYGNLALQLRIQKEYTGTIDGLDIHEPWVTQLEKHNLYDNVFLGDVRDLDDIPLEKYDLVVCMETIEHVSRSEGIDVIKTLQERARDLIISTPCTTYKNIDVKHRGDTHFTGNLTMKHKSGYTPSDFSGFDVNLITVHYVPRYFLPLYHLRARLIGGSVVTQNIVASRFLDNGSTLALLETIKPSSGFEARDIQTEYLIQKE